MPETQDAAEPSIQAPPTHLEERLSSVLERVASLLMLVLAIFLLVFVVVALIGVVTAVAGPLAHGHSYTEAAIEGLDSTFLAIILLELVHTTLSRGPITVQVQEFIAIGITAAVRSGLEVAATSHVGDQRDVVTALVLDALAVLVLVAALWLVRQRLHVERGGDADDS